jgi:hypothetical protein
MGPDNVPAPGLARSPYRTGPRAVLVPATPARQRKASRGALLTAPGWSTGAVG